MEPSEYQRIGRLEARHFRYRGVRALLLSALARHLTRRDGRARILDAGCGPGGLTARLRDHGSVVALDSSPLALAALPDGHDLAAVRGDVGCLPLVDGCFDAVVCVDVLYHRGVEDDAAALAELARVCRPGGLVLLHLPAHEWLRGPHDRQVHTARRYTRADVRRLAARARLDVVRVAWSGCAWLPVAACLRGVTRSGAPARSDLAALPAPVNAPLSWWARAEAALALRGLLPWGLSVFAVLRRPGVTTVPSQ